MFQSEELPCLQSAIVVLHALPFILVSEKKHRSLICHHIPWDIYTCTVKSHSRQALACSSWALSSSRCCTSSNWYFRVICLFSIDLQDTSDLNQMVTIAESQILKTWAARWSLVSNLLFMTPRWSNHATTSPVMASIPARWQAKEFIPWLLLTTILFVHCLQA